MSQRTISLDVVASNVRERLVAARLALTDLFQAFGVAEVHQIGEGGVIRSRYWDQSTLKSWPSSAEVEISDLTLDEEARRPRA